MDPEKCAPICGRGPLFNDLWSARFASRLAFKAPDPRLIYLNHASHGAPSLADLISAAPRWVRTWTWSTFRGPPRRRLYWDADDLAERFGWRGTWDPAPAPRLRAFLCPDLALPDLLALARAVSSARATR